MYRASQASPASSGLLFPRRNLGLPRRANAKGLPAVLPFTGLFELVGAHNRHAGSLFPIAALRAIYPLRGGRARGD